MKNLNLNSLRVFAAAARHGNFLRAGEELNISHGAVSQRIKQLEIDLGASLFERKPRGVELTQAGRNYYQAVETAMSTLSEATSEIRDTGQEIILHMPPSFASKWLMPRLRDLSHTHPGLRVVFEAQEAVLNRQFRRNEAAIRHAKSCRPTKGHDHICLAELVLVAVCSPNLSTRLSKFDLDEARTLPLIQDAHRRWERLFGRLGIAEPDELLTFNRTALAIDAAVNEQGVAIAPTLLVQRDIDEGRLVSVWEDSVSSGEYLFLISPTQHSKFAPLVQTTKWIKAQFDI